MKIKEEAVIEEYSGKDYTKVSFVPDFKRFKVKEIDSDLYKLMCRRVYDLAGITANGVTVYLNDQKVEIKNFRDYVDLFLSKDDFRLYENQDRWDVVVALTDGQFEQVSFVNAICTSNGGTHVKYLTDQIVIRLTDYISKKHKGVQVKPHQIKQSLRIFVNCLIENPTFDSQTKETMTLKENAFGSECKLSEKFFKELLKSPIVNNIMNFYKAKENSSLHKALSVKTKKKVKLLGIEKLEDANKAGTKESSRCTLILTEGDSAKSLAMAGMEIVGRDFYGVFPLKGKLLNVREAAIKKLTNNEEIQNLLKIVGLNVQKDYLEDKSPLRYGKLMIMTDQDADGSHIKGLIINFIHFFWPSLIRRNDFVCEFITPIVKVATKTFSFPFFTLNDFHDWQKQQEKANYTVKYYKGLGTSTTKEGKEYFRDLSKHKITFLYQGSHDDAAIELPFGNDVSKRKEWLKVYDPMSTIDHSKGEITYSDFVNKELIHFSSYDNVRSIPSVLDGLKPSERKILYSCLKRNLKTELKVAQLAGYVAEHSAYHHGEASLCSTIVNMAQDFIGTNNVNFLMPIGQFGNRYVGPKAAASPRYIFTCLNHLTRLLFREEDDVLLNYNEDDGQKIEPVK